eukprot:2730542-Amphidinium_carterae.1
MLRQVTIVNQIRPSYTMSLVYVPQHLESGSLQKDFQGSRKEEPLGPTKTAVSSCDVVGDANDQQKIPKLYQHRLPKVPTNARRKSKTNVVLVCQQQPKLPIHDALSLQGCGCHLPAKSKDTYQNLANAPLREAPQIPAHGLGLEFASLVCANTKLLH